MRIARFLLLLGSLLLLWGVASFFVPFESGDLVAPDLAYSIFYVVMGVLLLWSGTTWNPEIRHAYARIVGALFILLAIVGWAVAGRPEPNLWATHLSHVDNIVHLVIGVLAVGAGAWAKRDDVYQEPLGTTMNLR